MNYNCEFCINKEYKSESGLWKHKQKKHRAEIDKLKIQELKKSQYYLCSYCNKQFKHYQSRWTHEQKCKETNKLSLPNEIQMLKNEIKELKLNRNNKTPNIQNIQNITNIQNTIQNTTIQNNIQYIIARPTCENIDLLTFEE